MSFKITLSDSPTPTDWLPVGGKAILGKINIDDFEESFAVVIGYWTPADYTKQWAEALEMLLSSPACTKSALVTQMYDPAKPEPGYVVDWWVLYKDNDGTNVHVQNQSIARKDLSQPFDPSDLYSYIHARETLSEEGDTISEWTTTTANLQNFLAELKQQA